MAADPVRVSILIEAEPEEIYRYFVESDSLVLWMGHCASLDPRPGGQFLVDIEGTAVRGRFLELDPPHRIVISWGFEESSALPPEASRVEIRLTREHLGTRVDLLHKGLSGDLASEHTAGWKHFLKLLAERIRDFASDDRQE